MKQHAKNVLVLLDRLGCNVVEARQGRTHVRIEFTHDGSMHLLFVSATPSSYRAFANTEAQIRRMTGIAKGGRPKGTKRHAARKPVSVVTVPKFTERPDPWASLRGDSRVLAYQADKAWEQFWRQCLDSAR